MDVRKYQARTMQEALAMVRRDLGPQAAVLHTREVHGGLWGWFSGVKKIEVVASTEINVPSRLPMRAAPINDGGVSLEIAPAGLKMPQAGERSPEFRDDVKGQLTELQSMVEELCRRTRSSGQLELPEGLFQLYTELLDHELSEELARELVEEVRLSVAPGEWTDIATLRARSEQIVERQFVCQGPFQLEPGRCHTVALVGPTGVGKTTTIAKLAANYRLREKRKVGLITVDTYRIAAVEQLRTYADIIDLPMQVVSTPKQMREAVHDMANLDLLLIDTAGRSPKDEVKIQELRSYLTEANADEVHLVLSAVTAPNTLIRTAEAFSAVGTTALVVTKLDEAMSLGNLLPLLKTCQLPLSYVTHGQNVPDDIAVASAPRLVREVFGNVAVA